MFQAWQRAVFGENEAVSVVHRKKFGGEGNSPLDSCDGFSGN